MWKITLCVLCVFGAVVNDVAARSFADSQSQDDVGIVGGDEVDIKQYPYQVSLLLKGKHFCGGSIISEDYVMTAAHCARIAFYDINDLLIRAGSTDQQGGDLYEVDVIFYHPRFNLTNDDYDIGMMKVAGKIDINGKTVDTVKLAEYDIELNAGELVTVSGWGDTTGQGNYSDVLRATTLPIVDKKHCTELWQKENVTLTDRMVCAGFKEPGHSACYGDAGGPVVDKNSVQYGIVSFGAKDCQGNLPNVYTNVAYLRAWIRTHTSA